MALSRGIPIWLGVIIQLVRINGKTLSEVRSNLLRRNSEEYSDWSALDKDKRQRQDNLEEGEWIAICKTGLQRNLLAKPVISTYFERVVQPLQREHYSVDTFLSIRDAKSSLETMKRAYRAVSVRQLNMTSPSGLPGDPIVQQFVTIQDCYHQVEAVEESRGKTYTWLYKLRSDQVFLSDVPIPRSLSEHHVYVPWSGAMAGTPNFRCNNDHAFFCPRKLCRPYFNYVELFTSPFLQKGGKLHVPSGNNGPPDAFYDLPLPPEPVQASWYFFARYGGDQPCTNHSQDPSTCCGLIREVNWFYTLSRDPVPCSKCEMACWYNLDECGAKSWWPARNKSLCDEVHARCYRIHEDWMNTAECLKHKCDMA